MTTLHPLPRASTASTFWNTLIWLMLASLGLLLVTSMARGAPCWGVALFSVLLAYPLWLALNESFLFDRRLLLTGATPEGCLARRWFWGGRLGGILRIPLAFAMAMLLLALSLGLKAHQWALLLADALVLTVLYRFIQASAASEVHPHMLGPWVRGWPLRWINLGLLTLAFFILSFFVLGAPDLRQADWQTVTEQAFHVGREGIACPMMGWLTGGLESLEQGSWALAQRYIPALPHLEWRIAAWVLLLLQLSVLSLLYTRLLLGVLTLIESRRLRVETVTGESALAKTFILTILILALPTIYAALRLQDLDPRQFESPTQPLLAWVDPCKGTPAPHPDPAIQARLDAEQARVNEALAQRIDEEVERLFAPVEAAVDDFLDWYFTVVGEYQRLIALAAGDFTKLMADQFDAHVFGATDFHARQSRLEQGLVDETLARLSEVSHALKEQIEAQMRADPCLRVTLDATALGRLDRDALRAGVALGTGTVVGAVTVGTILSQKVVAAVIAKVAAKKSMQAAAVMAAKLAAKEGGGVLAATLGGIAVCAPSGPWAIACGVGAGIATWLAIDKVAIEIDEAVSRDAMRADILAVLGEEKEALKQALKQQHAALIGHLSSRIESTIDGVFIPARDGL